MIFAATSSVCDRLLYPHPPVLSEENTLCNTSFTDSHPDLEQIYSESQGLSRRIVVVEQLNERYDTKFQQC